jgi:hypothetical protein
MHLDGDRRPEATRNLRRVRLSGRAEGARGSVGREVAGDHPARRIPDGMMRWRNTQWIGGNSALAFSEPEGVSLRMNK